jgi:hypothetical protein
MMRKHIVFLVFAAELGLTTAGAAQEPTVTPKPVAHVYHGPELVPIAYTTDMLVTFEAVQHELKLTDAQKKQQETIIENGREKLQKARQSAKGVQQIRSAIEAVRQETEAAVEQSLDPGQRDRLNQIQLQATGPRAFERPELQKLLEMSQDQVDRVKRIVDEALNEIEKASEIPINLKPKGEEPTLEEVDEYVKSPQFLAARDASRQRLKDVRSSVQDRIAGVLSTRQNEAYRKVPGEPFDLAELRPPWIQRDEHARLAKAVARGLGLLGQRADPKFDVKVARPAYTQVHPTVLIDEAHHNFHTAGGRYKPFAQLMANDGYHVVPNRAKFTNDALKGCNVLVIANALGAEDMGSSDAAKSAFTDAECDAVRDWVEHGGSLLLITDHAPMGSAALSLGKRFGVGMSTTTTIDPVNKAADQGPASLMFTRENKLLAEHPITHGRDDSERVNRVQTFTGQSLKGPEGSVAFLKLGDTAVDSGESGEVSAAGRAQGIAFAHGKGRVVVLGEAAELSAQIAGAGDFKMGMNVPGIDNRQMALNIMHWLSGLLEPAQNARKKAA